MAELMGCKVDEEKININEACTCSEDAVIKDDRVEQTDSEMTGIREENLRLKTLLQEIERDYKSLQMKFVHVFQKESKKNGSPSPIQAGNFTHADDQELVWLRLGTSPNDCNKENLHVQRSNSCKFTSEDDGVKLGLDCNLEKNLKSEDSYSLTGKKEDDDGGEKRTGSNVLKTQRNGDGELSQTSAKRARVSVRARCDTPTMNDGCQWRKYGQKISKGNPCPRAYYRCTVSPSCPVRKQVQRSVEDMSILITTYEGTHNHPLPLSATTMASTTSAAASMLLSGSTTSQPSATAAPPSHLYAQPPFHPCSNNPTTQPYLFPSSSSTTPTITLDLTAHPSTAHGGLSLYPSACRANPRFPTASLSFSPTNSSVVPAAWAHQSVFPGKPAQEQKFSQASTEQALTESLTKAITSDPSFRSVIAAMISTMAANGGPEKGGSEMKGENHESNLKFSEQISAANMNQHT